MVSGADSVPSASDVDTRPPPAVEDGLQCFGFDQRVAAVERLAGGLISDVWLVRYADGRPIVVKSLHDDRFRDLYRIESEGLAALRATGTVQTPQVHGASDSLLVMEALSPRDDDGTLWEAFAHDLASLHRSTVHTHFGWREDTYFGLVKQRNDWMDDGHSFFAQSRLLRYLEEPGISDTLNLSDRRALERLCDRLEEIIPSMPPVLTHGDLYANNVVCGSGSLALIDPAVSYTWAEVDLANFYCSVRPPSSERFLEVYQEINASPEGWKERMPILNLSILMASIAHTSILPPAALTGVLDAIRETLKPFYPAIG